MSNTLTADAISSQGLVYLEDTAEAHAALDGFVRRHPAASPYHLTAWRAAVAEAYRHKAKVLVARDNGVITGCLPVCVVGRPFGRARWSALPFCDLGGPLAESAELARQLSTRLAHDAAAAGASALELRDTAHLPSDEPNLAGRKVRMVLELPGSAETLMKSYAPKLRSQIRKAEKNGLVAAIETGSSAVRAFYDVYSRNMRRLGSPAHSRAWFEAVQKHYGKDMFIMVVRHEGKAIGAGLVLCCGGKAAIPWASTLADYNALAPNMLLYWAIQAHLCESGVRSFDFGRSTYGEGTYKFKKQWGALPYALEWQEWDGSGMRSKPAAAVPGGGSLRLLVEAAWQRLPLSLANGLGPRLRRYITL